MSALLSKERFLVKKMTSHFYRLLEVHEYHTKLILWLIKLKKKPTLHARTFLLWNLWVKVKWLFGGTKLILHAKKSISQYDMKRVGQVPLWDLNVMWLQAQLSFFVISCGFVGQCLLFLCGGTLDVSCDDKKQA